VIPKWEHLTTHVTHTNSKLSNQIIMFIEICVKYHLSSFLFENVFTLRDVICLVLLAFVALFRFEDVLTSVIQLTDNQSTLDI